MVKEKKGNYGRKRRDSRPQFLPSCLNRWPSSRSQCVWHHSSTLLLHIHSCARQTTLFLTTLPVSFLSFVVSRQWELGVDLPSLDTLLRVPSVNGTRLSSRSSTHSPSPLLGSHVSSTRPVRVSGLSPSCRFHPFFTIPCLSSFSRYHSSARNLPCPLEIASTGDKDEKGEVERRVFAGSRLPSRRHVR